MKLIYTLKSKNLPEGFSARNPRYFVSAERDVKTVIIEGGYPEIVKAYRDAGVDVALGEAAGSGEGEAAEPFKNEEGVKTETTPKSFSAMTALELKKHLTDQGVEFESKASKAQLLELVQE